jgi:hypothetical protein
MPSTVIRSFSYNEDESKLRIVFLSGKVHDYFQVSKEVYAAMRMAFSKGKFYNEHVKSNYHFEEVRDLKVSE